MYGLPSVAYGRTARQRERGISPRNSAGTFFADKPDRFFRVTKFWMDEASGIALALRTGVPPPNSKATKAEFIYYFTFESKNRMKTAGACGAPDQAAFDFSVLSHK